MVKPKFHYNLPNQRLWYWVTAELAQQALSDLYVKSSSLKSFSWRKSSLRNRMKKRRNAREPDS